MDIENQGQDESERATGRNAILECESACMEWSSMEADRIRGTECIRGTISGRGPMSPARRWMSQNRS